MPPGKGFYGPKYKESRSGEKRLAPMALLAAVPVLALFAWIGACALGGGGSSEQLVGDVPAENSNNNAPRPTDGPKVAPTRDPAKKVAGANEGAATVPANPAKPDIREYLIAGGKRFELPLSTHAGVEDYFGALRAEGKLHTGVDFSLVGLKNVPVESACSGFVTDASSDDIFGLHVTVDCGGDFTVILGWLDSLRVTNGNNVSKSTVVGMGQPDGFVHFEIRYKSVPLDPKDFVQIPGKEIVPWTPTATPTLRPDETPTPEATETPVPDPTSTSTPNPGGGGPVPTPEEPTATPGPPTATPTVTPTPTITPTPTRTPTPTKTPVPPKKTPTPPPRSQ